VRVSTGHSYLWQDGRLQALAVTVPPAGSFVGRWSIAMRLNGAPATLSGGLYHRPTPSLVWFWPIVVALACVLAVVRLRRPELDRRGARALAAIALAAFALASIGHQLHGRPTVTAGQLTVLGLELAVVAWGVVALVRRRHNWLSLFVVAGLAIWQGIALAPALTDGYVLLALPPALGRIAVAGCLAAGAGLLPLVFVMAERSGVARGRSGRRARGSAEGEPPEPAAAQVWERTA
jgi:ABC-type Co2+ transport system permease subunit